MEERGMACKQSNSKSGIDNGIKLPIEELYNKNDGKHHYISRVSHKMNLQSLESSWMMPYHEGMNDGEQFGF
jgi:hypothetical protein